MLGCLFYALIIIKKVEAYLMLLPQVRNGGERRVFKDINFAPMPNPIRCRRPAPTYNQILEVISGIT